jgi:hypothetical protein
MAQAHENVLIGQVALVSKLGLRLPMRLCMQNGGKLSKAKRGEFGELSDAEIAAIEAAIAAVAADPGAGRIIHPTMS